MAEKETPQQTIERLLATVASLTSELAASNKALETFKAQAAQASADEVIIREKMTHGLTRDQAVSVIHRQRAHDAAEKAQADAAAKAKEAKTK